MRKQEKDDTLCASEDESGENANSDDETAEENKDRNCMKIMEENIKMKQELKMYKELYLQQVTVR